MSDYPPPPGSGRDPEPDDHADSGGDADDTRHMEAAPPPPAPPPTSPPPSAPGWGVPPAASDTGGDTGPDSPAAPSSPPGGDAGEWAPPGGSGGYAAPPPPPPPPGSGYGAFGGGAGGAGGMGPVDPAGYSVGGAFTWAFNAFKGNAGPLVLATLVVFVASAVVAGIASVFTGAAVGSMDSLGSFSLTSLAASWVQFFLSTAASVIVGAVVVKAALNLTRGEGLDLGRATEGINWGQVLIAGVIVGAATALGWLLCFVPGIILSFLFAFTTYFVVDRDQDAVTAIKSSIDLVRSHIGQLVVFFLACFGVYILGALACCIGLLVAWPVVALATAYTYRSLSGDAVQA